MNKLRLNLTSSLILFFLVSLFLSFSSSIAWAAAGDEQFLGVGLGYNSYNKADVDDLGKPWVFNWGVGDSVSTGKHPELDFAGKYVPTLYNCDLSNFTAFSAWIEAHQYSGYALIFNEPDNLDENEGSCSTPMTEAVDAIDRVISWRDTYYTNTGNYVDLIFGGTYASPNSAWSGYNSAKGGFWMDRFRTAWQAAHPGYTWPNVQGVHFHTYAYTGYTDATNNTNFIEDDWGATGGWKEYLIAHPEVKGTKNQVWISEVGIVNSTIAQSTVNTIMGNVLPYFKAAQADGLDRVAWFTMSTNAANRLARYNTSLVDQATQVKTSLWTTFYNLCTGTSGYCSLHPIDVKDTTVAGNYIDNNRNPTDTCDSGFNWCRWVRNSSSESYIQGSGDLLLRSAATAGDYGSCWQKYLVGAQPNGATYRISADFKSNFPTSKAFIQLETPTNQNYAPWWYLNTSKTMSNDITVYDPLPGNIIFKFCTWGTNLPTEAYATLQNVSVKKISDATLTVKDSSIGGNKVSDSMSSDGLCNTGEWCRTYRDNNYTINTNAIDGSGNLKIAATATTGNYGQCWKQVLQGGTASGTNYNVTAHVDSGFNTNTSFIQIETASNPSYATYYTNGTGAVINQNLTVTDATTNYVAIKFCSYGTNTSAVNATLDKISMKKI